MYDYVVVGGGSAGCVLADRLSEDGISQVCLLESGPVDSNPFIRVPFGIIVVNRSKALNWKFWTVPQPGCANRPMFWPRGKTLGGSSAINAMCYARGNPHDYDVWADLGNDGWSFQEVLPYFKKLENFEPGADDYHALGGPLNVTNHRYINPLVKVFIAAGKQAGYALTKDFNGECPNGVGYYHVMQINGQRCSNAHAYLRTARQRKNLTIITHAHATKLLLDGKKINGVRYHYAGGDHDIHAAREVILSAGAIGSPQILLLSGIGPAAELQKHGIRIEHELPGVGENLQDHLDIHITCLEKTREAISLNPTWLPRGIKNLFLYLLGHRGEFTSNFAQAGGFIKSDSNLPYADLQWHFVPAVDSFHVQDLRAACKYYGYTLRTCLLHPYSRGRVTLKNTDPMSPPAIDPNYLADARDLQRLVTGFKKAREILSQPAFGSHCLREFEPGDKVQTDEEIEAYIRSRAETIYHPVGTCKMGNDKMAVVNSQLKVHGIQGLRVADASIMPTIVSGNTNAPVTMIAEKAADMILGEKEPE